MISIKNINKSFGDLQVLKSVSLDVNTSEILSIVGPSGAGKTTLLQIIGTLDTPDSGEILIHGTNVLALKDRKLAQFRNKNLGFVFQFHHLLPEFTAIENVMIPGMIAKKSDSLILKEASDLLDFLGLSERLNHKPHELSGGEQQRVAVARALINKPEILLADEPSGNLDSKNATDLHHWLLKLRNELKQTIIVVTHNEELANMADRKIAMKDGRIIA